MIEAILTEAARSDYDFRTTACPKDPMRDSWPEWVAYYRTKRAIAAVLRPSSILEIGVRYGYSALAFLDGSPDATYLGWDLDNGSYGGMIGASEWARAELAPFGARATVETQDSQQVVALDRDWGLVHIDGQQNYTGTLHDLDLAAWAATWALVDGCHWSADNWRACSAWLYSTQDAYRWAALIPGYCGDLLIRMAR